MDNQEIRINKYLSQSGICSRREADRIIESGRVSVNKQPATLGTKVTEGDLVEVDGRVVSSVDKLILLLLNKPVGIECTTDLKNKDNIISFLNYNERVFPVGRLDKNSEGLILLTNNGELSDKLMRGANYHEKEYIVTVDKRVTKEFVEKMSKGIPLVDEEHNLNTVTRECVVEKLGEYTFRIILTQGLNRQIRRMCRYLSYQVVKLKRVRIMNIELGNLATGKYRKATAGEIEMLKKSIDMK